jgi:glycosyltransferase involved in cell wall biosynthesis
VSSKAQEHSPSDQFDPTPGVQDELGEGRRLKVLLVGHACSPYLGSEPGFTWNWALHLSAHHRICVLTHPHYRHHIENYQRENPGLDVQFEWLNLPEKRDPWDPEAGERGIRPHYLLWQRAAFKRASELLARQGFDLVHHVSWGTLSAPPALWKLPVPFVWGPIGGGQTAPDMFLDYFGQNRHQERLRNLRVKSLHLLPPVRRAASNSRFVCATNSETATILRRAGATKVSLVLDAGLPPDAINDQPADRSARDGTNILWAGRLESRKGLRLALEAIAHTDRCHLTVAGSGSVMEAGRATALMLGIADRVEWLGEVPHEAMGDLFLDSDVFLFTSLRDSTGSVVLEAMARALPVVALNHQGVGTFLPPEAALKIPLSDPDSVGAALGDALTALVESNEKRTAMGRAAWEWARLQTWDRRAAEMSDRYESIAHGLPPARVPA